jgi:hypothetical protein
MKSMTNLLVFKNLLL